MADSVMLRVANINQPVIAAPPIRIDDGAGCDTTANNPLQSALFTIGDDLREDAAISFEDAEDDGLARGSATALATHATSAEVRLINFNFAGREGRRAKTLLRDALSDFEKDRGYALARQGGQLSRFAGGQIERKIAHELAEFTFTNFGTPVIAV